MEFTKKMSGKELLEQCTKIVASLPDFRGNAKNSVPSKDFFEPLFHSATENNLHSHLQYLESKLCNQEAFSTGGNIDISKIYSSKEINLQEASSKSKVTTLGNYARLILIRLASEGIVTLSSDFKPSINDQSSFTTALSYKDVYPKSVISLLAMTTESRAKSHPELIEKIFFEHLKETGIRYKTAAASMMTMARVCLTQGVNELCDFNINHWVAFKDDYDKKANSVLTISPLIKTISIVYQKPELEREYEKHALSSKHAPSLSAPHKKNSLSEVKSIPGNSAEARNLIGELFYTNKKGVRVSTYPLSIEIYRSYRIAVVSYDCWDSHTIDISDFHTESIDGEKCNIWKIAQRDYISKKIELATKKVASSRLRYLNAYLFSYLPSYYESLSSSPFEYPTKPSKFISTVFVERSPIFEAEIGDIPSDFRFPVSIKSFVEDLTSISSKRSTLGNNAARDVLREIDNFFDHLLTLSSDDKSDYYLASNPMKGTSKKSLGIKYIKSNKSIFPVDYWSGFRLFLKKITEHIINNNISNIRSLKPKSYTLESLSRYHVNESFDYFGKEVNINEVDLSKLTRFQFLTTSDRLINLPDHIYFAQLLFIAYSGNRSSNTHWMDAENFDYLYNIKGHDNKDNFVPIIINTDKAKDRAFESYIPNFIFRALVNTREILKLNQFKWCYESLPYQNNKESKWGDIVPLFRRSEKHNSVVEGNLYIALEMYEKCLTESRVDFDSQLLNSPSLHLDSNEFIYIKNQCKPLPYYTAAKINYTQEKSASFTPIKRTTLLTPHSLRVMVNSVFSPLIGDELISNFMTGQTTSTVGYYTVEFTDESSQDLIAHLRNLLKLGNMDIARPEKTVINEEDFKKRIENGTALEYYQCQSVNLKPIDTDDEDEIIVESGLSVMTLSQMNSLAFNRTHICPFNNECPRSIIKSIGEKNCSECLYAITTTNHLPSIAAKIRKLSEDIVEIRNRLNSSNLLQDEIDQLEKQKDINVREACNWYVRLTIANQSKEQFIISEAGRKRLVYDNNVTSADSSKETQLLKRLYETVGCEALQSESLKKRALRLSRKIESLAISGHWSTYQDDSEVNEALNNFINVCKIYGLDEAKQILSISENNKNETNKKLKLLGEIK